MSYIHYLCVPWCAVVCRMCAVVAGEGAAKTAYLEVWDEDSLGADDIIGVGTLPLAELVRHNGTVSFLLHGMCLNMPQYQNRSHTASTQVFCTRRLAAR